LSCWQRVPNKGFFFGLLVAWLVLFQYLGNSTFGYGATPSLFNWMYTGFKGGEGVSLFQSDGVYGIAMPAVVLVLFWFKRKELLRLPARLWWPPLLLVLLGLSLHILGYLVQQPRVSVVGLFLGIYGLMGIAWGFAWMRASFFPFFLFAFCMPLGSMADMVTFPLRLLVTKIVEVICHFIAIDVIREGTILRDATGHYQYDVAAACSGIKSLMATFGLAVILAFFSMRTWWKRLLMMGSAVPLALAGNIIRLLAIVIAAEIGGPSWGNAVHEGGPGGIFVLILYIPSFVGLLMLERKLGEKPIENEPVAREAVPA
jgi:exosortase